MRLQVDHLTHYDYTPAVSEALHRLHLAPRHGEGQQVLQHEMQIAPQPARVDRSTDAFGNTTHFFSLSEPHTTLSVRSGSVVQTVGAPALPPDLPWEAVRELLRYARGQTPMAASEFAAPSELIDPHPELLAYARSSFADGRPLADAALDLMHRVHADFRYAPQATDVHTPVIEAFRMRRGVCQDFAHLMIACLRALGLAARYVSGYMLTHPPPGQARLIGADASHAWCAVWLAQPDGNTAGTWLELDPTNDRVPGEEHVRVAVGRDYADVSPVRGVIQGAAAHTLRVEVTVMPVAEPQSSVQDPT